MSTRVGIRIPKYKKYREIPKFNSIEYRKCSIPKFQYYWIPKQIQYWSSIIPKFSILVLKIPNFQTTWIMRIIFCKNWRTDFFFKFFSKFSVFFGIFGIFQYFSVGFGIRHRKSFILKKKFREKKFKFSVFLQDFDAFSVFSVFQDYWKYE